METEKKLREEVLVTFQFVGENVNPDVLTAMIGIEPTNAHHQGESVKKHPEHIYPTGFWALDSSISSDHTLKEHLDQLLNVLEPTAANIKKLTDIGLKPTFYCGFFIIGTTASIKLEMDILQRIAKLGVSLECYIYSDGDEES